MKGGDKSRVMGINCPADAATLRLGPLPFLLLSVLMGAVGALGAFVFRWLIGSVHNLFFLGQFSGAYDANAHTPESPWGIGIFFVPVVGAAIVSFLVQRFAHEAKGHGVPEVMDAIYHREGKIRPIVAIIKSLASAVSIGTGGSVGREGPIVQIGSSFGSTLGQWLRLPVWQRITLIAAGAGSGIAATFNTPLGGVLFTTELILHEVSSKTLIPVIVATATATAIGRVLFGAHPSFIIPPLESSYLPAGIEVFLLYALLGVVMGLVSVAYIRSLYVFEDLFDGLHRLSYPLKHLLAMAVVGLMMLLFYRGAGHYYIGGVGYATIQDLLSGSNPGFLFVLLLAFGKLVATNLTLGSGGSGGIFSPALFLGATVGSAYGVIAHRLFPGAAPSTVAFVVAGMAGVVGGSTGAALTAITMVFEMTLDYSVIVPMTLTVSISYGVRKLLCSDSIYTMKLKKRGSLLPDGSQVNFLQLTRARETMSKDFVTVPESQSISVSLSTIHERHDFWLVLKKDDSLAGILDRSSVLEAVEARQGERSSGDLASQAYCIIEEGVPLVGVVAEMRASNASLVVVTKKTDGEMRSKDVSGIITKALLAEATLQAIESTSDFDVASRRTIFARRTRS